MAGYGWKCSSGLTVVAAAALAAAACDLGSITDPPAEAPAAARLAFVVQESGQPALYVQNADGTGRVRIHFAGARELPGNPDVVPPVRDENILALGPLAWSPDGHRLAVVVTLAYDQSELVVVNEDGADARVASLNSQIIMTAPDWSPDGTRLAYGMSTASHAQGVQVFVTDLAADTWRQLTNDAPVGSAGTDLRWSLDAATVYLWRTIGQTPANEWLSRIWAVDAVTGSAHLLADSLAGMVQDVGRVGAWALIVRNVTQTPGQDGVRELVRRPLFGYGPELRLVQGNLWWARASADDRGVTVVADADPSPGSTSFGGWVVPIGGGTAIPIAGLDPNAYVLDVQFH